MKTVRMLAGLLLSVLFALSVASFHSSADDGPSKRYSAAEFFDTTAFAASNPSGFAWSPDGSKVLVNSDESGVFNVYAVDVATGKRTQLTQSTTSANFSLGYFPHDERILFSADIGGNELTHIWMMGEDGVAEDLTPGEKTKAIFLGWTPDGKNFLAMTNERDASVFDVYQYDAGSFERRPMFQNDGNMMVGAVSRDGRWVAMAKTHSNDNNDIYLYDTAGGDKPVLITAHEGAISHGIYDFTPDGSKLIFATDEHGEWRSAWSHDLATGEKKPWLEADWDVSFVGFSKTGKYQVSGVNADASTVLSLVDLATGEPLMLPELPAGNPGNIRFNHDDTKFSMILSSDTSPADLYAVDLKAQTIKRLTTSLSDKINQDDLVESTIVRYPSYDGTLIPSVFFKPKGASAANPAPALVLVHGGPGGQTRQGYRAMVQHLVNHGYAVLGANNRGSSGYGKTFFHMDDKRHGEDDLMDIVHGRKYLETLDWVDKDRIGIIGGSYGGYMVAAALAFQPEVFDVGINIFGVTNWVRTLKSIPAWWGPARQSLYDELGDPATEEERLHRISPLFHAKNIVRPMLVIQGANDPRVLQVESDELVEAARANGTPVEYVLFPDEGHGFRKRSNRITASEAYLKFLETYLRGME